MKKLEVLARVHTHTHTQGNLINKENKVENINLYISIYKTDQLK